MISAAGLLTESEREVALVYLLTNDALAAYRQAYPKQEDKPDGEVRRAALQILGRPHVKSFIEYAQKDPSEIAASILRDQMLNGSETQRLRAAQLILNRDSKLSARDGIEHWAALLKQAGAQIEVPVPPGAESVVVSFSDVVAGRATITLPFEARMWLLHRAGAPWNDLDPDASLSELQKELLRREERLMIVHGGSGVGKSVLGGAFGVLGLLIPNFLTFVVAPTYDLCGAEFQYIYRGFIALCGLAGAKRISFTNTARNTDMEIVTHWNSTVRCYSLDRERGQSLLGKECDQVILGEGSQIDEDIYQRRILRAVDRRAKVTKFGFARKTGTVKIFTTPNEHEGASAWEWERIQTLTDQRPEKLHVDCVPWHRTAYLREANVLENPSYSRDVYEQRRLSLTSEAFEEQYEGKMTRRSGLVVKEYDPRKHKVEMPERKLLQSMRFGVGIDTGKHFAALLAGLTRKPELFLLGEVYTKELSITDNAAALRAMLVDVLAEPLGLAADAPETYGLIRDRIDLWTIDPSSQNKEDMSELLDAPVAFEKTEILPTLDVVRNLFKGDQLLVVEDLEFWQWEMNRYIWRPILTRNVPGRTMYEPRKQNDHLIDAMRFVVPQLWAMGPLEEEPVSTTFEENWARQQRMEVYGHLVANLRGPAMHSPYDIYRELG